MIGVPSVLAPTVEAMVAVPMLIITDVRTPAIITGAASGSSTFTSPCQALTPVPATSHTTHLGYAASQDGVPCRMVNPPYNISATIAGSRPEPVARTAVASADTRRKVCTVAEFARASGRNSQPVGLVAA